MSKKRWNVLGLLLAIGLLMVVAVVPAFAQGSSPQNQASMFGRNQLKTLTGSDVYQFSYNGNKDASFEIRANSQPANAMKFTVFNSTQWQQMGAVLDKEDAKNRTLGQGTRVSVTKDGETTTDLSSDLIYRGGGKGGGTFYVLVEPNQGFQNQDIRYWIDFSGDASNVQFMSAQGNDLNQMAAAGTGDQTAQGPQTLPVTGAAQQGTGPQTLPQTGGGALLGLAMAGLSALAGGLALRRR